MIKTFFLTTSFFLTIFLCNCYAFDDGDFQYWNTESISWKIDDDWKLNLAEEFRFGDDARNFYYQYSDLGATYSGKLKWLDLGVNYRHILEEKKDKWKQENRPHLNAALKFNLRGYNLNNRSRLEYRNREEADNTWRYRNKTTLGIPLKLTRLEIWPYVADEIFIDFDQKELNRNRLYLGFKMNLLKNLKGEIYYLRQSTKGSSWKDYNVCGTKLKLVF